VPKRIDNLITRILLLIIILWDANEAISQKMEVHNHNHDMRAGFRNSFEISLKKKYDSISVSASHGSVAAERSIFFLTADSSGIDTVYVSFYFRRKLVQQDTVSFNIIQPEVFPRFQSDLLKGRKLKISYLRAIGGVLFNIRVNDYHWEPIAIASYRFSVVRDESCIFSKVEYSNRFSDEVKAEIELLRAGDLIIISQTMLNVQYTGQANILPGIFEIE
jgi:hypothetical protein